MKYHKYKHTTCDVPNLTHFQFLKHNLDIEHFDNLIIPNTNCPFGFGLLSFLAFQPKSSESKKAIQKPAYTPYQIQKYSKLALFSSCKKPLKNSLESSYEVKTGFLYFQIFFVADLAKEKSQH